MRRILAVTAALMLLLSLLGPMVLADRGGNGRGQGNTPQTQEPSRGPAQDDGDEQDRQDSWKAAKEEAKRAREEAKEEAKAERERARTDASDDDAEGDDSEQDVPNQGNGRGRGSSEENRNRHVQGQVRVEDPEDLDDDSNDVADDEQDDDIDRDDDDDADDADDGDDDDIDSDDDDADDDDVVDADDELDDTDSDRVADDDADDSDDEKRFLPSIARRIEKWQRKVQQSAKHANKTNNGVKPFMLEGQPEIDADGNLSVTVWKGNKIVRDHQYREDSSTVTVSPTDVIRIVGPTGVTVCEGTLEECLPDPLPEDAVVKAWGRVETGDDDNAEFVACRITITLPTMPEPEPTATLPTPTATLPTPTATLPTPTATVPTPTATLPTPTATVPTPTATLPTPTATAAG